ncbi:RVT-1 domain containing protein [Pyrenophora tritici-repentis]|uniref:RVT-1 domain containing protein n=1 Tax=Pyrenophora tritici-repentis TaxID=45151 RepID=A0A922SW82_9PLEO|nr:RVT-1 domain containing protein [Pyrenophora tritici-repentis]
MPETTNLLHSSQIGGRNKKSAIDAALLLVDQIQHKKQQGQITSTVFVDVKGAFDHVIHNRFLDRLKKLGLPISLICWAKSFLSNRTLRLAFDNKIEEFSKIRAGIPQGSPVSPIFFLIYIRDLFPALQSFQLSYIDDLSLTTSSTSLKKNIRALQKEIATLFAKGEQLDIIFDTSKTELIHFTAKKERIERALILPNNDRIEHKDTVKWLGIRLSNKQDRKLRFGYADDINLYRVSHSLDENVALLAEDLKSINEWGAANKITFAPEKRELIHLTRQKGLHAPPIQLEDQTIHPIAPAQGGSQTALRWLGVWFDRGLTFKKHVAERAAQARKVANHLRSLANTAHGPPAGSLRKAAITCILPILLYGAETWYEGRTKNPRIARVSRKPTVSTRVGWHLTTIDQALIAATKAILPAWRTTPNAVLLREAAMPSAQVALEEAKLRFAVHLRTIDDKHPLTNRTTLPLVIRGRAAGNRRIPRSKVQRVAQLLPATPRNVLASPHFSYGSRQDPTQGQGKDIAAQNFTIWWESLGQETITVFSDGSEQQINGTRVVTYGYAIYQGQAAVATGQGSLNALSHVFDAEAIGACRGLKHALQLSLPSQREIVLCIDSTSSASVIWGIRGAAPASSQWAFLQIHGAMEAYSVKTRWAPGHMKIVGNELADQLADNEAKDPHQPYGMAASPTRSGIRTVGRRLLEHTRDTWWKDKSSRLSAWYTQWQLPYDTRRTPAALWLPRRILAKVLMIRSTHGDFEWYHRKFNHEDTSKCLCGRPKTPEHLVFCKRATTHFKKWPLRPIVPPRTRQEGLAYLAQLIDQPQEFETFVKVTNSFYDE